MKFALVSPALPPSWSGQGVVIYRLLKGVNPKTYCLISREGYDDVASENEYTRRLPAPYYQLPPEFQDRFLVRRINRISLNRDFINILARAYHIARIIRRENCQAVVACTAGDVYYLPASYLASRLARVEFYAYIFDYYSQQWLDAKQRRLAERCEPILMKGAAGIIVPNEFMRAELHRNYGVEATVIRNCTDLSLYESPPDESPSTPRETVEEETDDDRDDRNGHEVRIVYTGALSDAQLEAFRNLIAALGLLRRPDAKLHLYTAQPPALLIQRGITGQIVFHEHQTVFAIAKTQMQADILFLPLAFNSPYPDIIKTSAPGKMGDYLAARRPILVHAPADSFIAWYFRQHECGLVVDEDDPAKLAVGIERLLCDGELRRRLSERAWERARADFNDELARAQFAQLLKLE